MKYMNVTCGFVLDSATKHGYQFLTELKGVCIGDVGIQPSVNLIFYPKTAQSTLKNFLIFSSQFILLARPS